MTRYLGPTNHRGSRIKASDGDGNTVTVPYDHAARNPHAVAAVALYRTLARVNPTTKRYRPGRPAMKLRFYRVYYTTPHRSTAPCGPFRGLAIVQARNLQDAADLFLSAANGGFAVVRIELRQSDQARLLAADVA